MPRWIRLGVAFVILAISLLAYVTSGPVRLVFSIAMIVLAVVAVVMRQREGRPSAADAPLNLHR